jgi:hypothetical protein
MVVHGKQQNASGDDKGDGGDAIRQLTTIGLGKAAKPK